MSTFKYYKNGQWNTVNGGSFVDTVPIDAVFEYDGDTVPSGYQEVNNWIKIELTSFTLPTIAAGGHGYVSFTYHMPSGYRLLSCKFQSAQISASAGLQLTLIYMGGAGTGTGYIQYYAPSAITADNQKTIGLDLCYIKETFIDFI